MGTPEEPQVTTNPDRVNRIDLLHDELKWSRDEAIPPGSVQLTALTDGRMIGAARMFLNDARSDFELMTLDPLTDPRLNPANEWIGQWLVGDGCYRGTAGNYNQVQFWVQDGVIVGIYGVWKEDFQRTFGYMLTRLEQGDMNMVPDDEQRRIIREQAIRNASLPRLRIPGDPPPRD